MDEQLYKKLILYVHKKFYSWNNINQLAEDIVQETYANFLSSKSYDKSKENFAYLSVSCIHAAYRMYAVSKKEENGIIYESTLIEETTIVEEIIKAEDASSVLASINTLKEIEKIVITQRYYGDYSFAQIARVNNLNINTVLSHHKRALEKLRPKLTATLGYGKEFDYD